MINILNLLWIIPVSMFLGAVWIIVFALMAAASTRDEEDF